MATAPASTTYDELVRRLNNHDYAPVYILHGEEGYFIDRLVTLFEDIVPDVDKDFNLYTMYAPEVELRVVEEACRRYPMMSERQVVIVKEAQASKENFDKLSNYASQPNPSTVLVICFRGAKAKGTELLAQMAAHGGVVFESKKLTEKTVGPTINHFIKDKGLNIEPKGLVMLRDYVGLDLSKIYNEIEKLTVALPQGATVTPEVIEKHIGISKDYNNFELVSALANKNTERAFKIINYFRLNPKNNPVVVTLSTVWTFFSNLMVMHYSRDKSDAGLCASIGRKGTWLPDDYKRGLNNYSPWQLIEISRAIRVADCRSKGIDSRMDAYDLLNDLVFHILTASGRYLK